MADYDVNAKLDAYRQSMKKKEEILSQLQQGVVETKKGNDKKTDRK